MSADIVAKGAAAWVAGEGPSEIKRRALSIEFCTRVISSGTSAVVKPVVGTGSSTDHERAKCGISECFVRLGVTVVA